MQTTILGIAIAIILALVAALVGPLLIDWGGYRSILEAEASRLTGVELRVTGAIDARLLPSPRITLNDIEIGAGSEKLRARTLGIELSLGPLLRGEWRASEMQLAGPQVTLGLDAAGRVQAPNISVSFDPDGLSIDRLSIVDGQVTLTDAANGATITLDRLWFNGEARSLIGPLKGEGAVRIGSDLYPFRLTAGRYDDDNGLKLHVNIDPVNYPLSIEADGNLMLGNGEPRFDGSLNLARPVGIAARGAAQVTQPWRVSGKLKASGQSALMEQVDIQYGSEDAGIKLTGLADFKFGKNPRFDGILSSRQVDLDRVLASGGGGRPLPAAAIRRLAELGGAAFRPTFPIQIGLGIDQLTLGGNSVQNLRGDISTDGGGWNLDRFEFRAPGFTQVRLSGHLAVTGDAVAFTGPAEVDSSDPKALAAWLEGRTETAAQSDLRPLSLRGEVTLGSEKVAIERLRAEFERKTIAGRLAYVFAAGNRSSRLDAELNAPELDIDAALGFGKALLAGSKAERPQEMTIAADIGRATIGGFVARNASARMKLDGGGLQIDRLSVADLGGAAFSASGRIVTTAPSPQGSIRVDLTAPDMAPVLAVLARFAPDTARTLTAAAPSMAPARLQARLAIEGSSPSQASTGIARVGIDGSLGKVRVALNGEASVDPVSMSANDIKLDGRLNAEDGKALLTMLGLERIVSVAAGPAAVTVTASGPVRGDMRLDTRITGGGVDANASGTARLFADTPSASLRATIVRANVAPLRPTSENPLPVSGTGRIVIAGNEVTVADLVGSIAGSAVRGRLGVTLSTPHRLQGEIEADSADGAGLLAAATGFPSAANSTDGSWVWSTEPFGNGAFGDLSGQVALKARRVDLSERLTAREFRATLRIGKDELALDDISGDVAGGHLAGRLSFNSGDEGLKARVRVSLNRADASSLLPASARPPVTGSLTVTADVEGSGLSPVALFGSLSGSGNFTLTDAQFASLDPRAFDAVTRAVDQGLPVDAGRISNVVTRALDSGRLVVKRAEGAITVSAGQLRVVNVTTDTKDVALSITGSVDLTDGGIDARLVLQGSSEAAGSRPDIYMALKGPVASPARTIDVSALNGWLTLRAVENQAKKLRAIEASPPPPPPPIQQSQRPEAIFPPVSPPVMVPAAPLPGAQAPALPPPIDVRPLAVPPRQPAASIGSQN